MWKGLQEVLTGFNINSLKAMQHEIDNVLF